MIVLLEASISMSVIALVYMAMTPLLSKKFTAKGRYYAWLIIIVGLILPFRFYPQVSAIYVDTLIPALKTVNSQSIAVTTSNIAASSSPFQWSTIAGGVWISGVVIFMVLHIIRHRRFLKMVKRWSTEVVDPKMLTILHDGQVQLQIKQRVDLRICPGISSPMLLGFIHPTILLPPDDIPEDELSLIFKHELVHYKRRDVWYKALMFLATALHWFNPFVYMMAREISIQCELSCDEEVVKNESIASRQKYVEAIIGVIRKQSKGQSKFSTNFYSGKQGMKQRVFSIMDVKSKQWGISLLAIIFVATLSTGTLLKVSTPKAESVMQEMDTKVDANLEEEHLENGISKSILPVENEEIHTDNDTSEPQLVEVNRLLVWEEGTESKQEFSADEGLIEIDEDSDVLRLLMDE